MIFLDESGDLSFNFDTDRTPRYFVVSAVVCEDAKKPSRIVKKALLSIDLSTRKRRNGVALHAVFLEKEAGNSEYKTIICRQDKTLAAFMLSHPAPLQQGIYLSCLEYIKKYRKSKGSK